MLKNLNALRPMLFGGEPHEAMAVITRTLDRMRVANEVIDTVGKQDDAVTSLVDPAFKLLRTTKVLGDCSLELYRAHCRELIIRVVNGEDTRPATEVEALYALLEISLHVPLSSQGSALADYLVRQVLDVDFDYDPIPEKYEGQIDMDLAVIQKKFSVSERNHLGSASEVA